MTIRNKEVRMLFLDFDQKVSNYKVNVNYGNYEEELTAFATEYLADNDEMPFDESEFDNNVDTFRSNSEKVIDKLSEAVNDVVDTLLEGGFNIEKLNFLCDDLNYVINHSDAEPSIDQGDFSFLDFARFSAPSVDVLVSSDDSSNYVVSVTDIVNIDNSNSDVNVSFGGSINEIDFSEVEYLIKEHSNEKALSR